MKHQLTFNIDEVRKALWEYLQNEGKPAPSDPEDGWCASESETNPATDNFDIIWEWTS